MGYIPNKTTVAMGGCQVKVLVVGAGPAGAAGGVPLGLRVVRLADIVGSIGRCSEFDEAFLPASERARGRWERIDRAFRRGEELPPVSLYKIGGLYFVEDGNHRVSVARYHGAEWIDAEVTEFRTRLPNNEAG